MKPPAGISRRSKAGSTPEETTEDTHYRQGVSASQVEQRVRLLPSVRSCSIDDDRVTVLVDGATDRRNVAAGVAYILADLGVERMVHVLGGSTPAVEVLPEAPRRSPGLVVAGIVAVVCIALGLTLLIVENIGASNPRRRTPPPRADVTTTVVTSTSPIPPPTFPPDWQLGSGS